MDNIKIITFNEYPENLKHMHLKPKRLWMRGSWPDLNKYKFLCVVGSRTPSQYGLDAVKKLVSGLAGYPISIVSGLAFGIDSASHEAALEAGLHCVGFPGHGLDWENMTDRGRLSLARRILEAGGAIVSEYAPEWKADWWMYPARNRLMAGLSHATVVVEGRKDSGSLMTAEYASQNSRDVLAVPGSIFSDLSYGPHMLLGQCAAPATSSADILKALGFEPPSKNEIPPERLASLDPLSQRIIKALKSGGATSDALSLDLNVNANELNARISFLELEGLVKTEGSLVRIA